VLVAIGREEGTVDAMMVVCVLVIQAQGVMQRSGEQANGE